MDEQHIVLWLGARSGLALAAAMLAAAASPPATETFEGSPGVTVRYYDVAGKDAAAMRAAMNRLRPTDPTDGSRVDALTSFDYRWRWQTLTGSDGACGVRDVTLDATYNVLLPRPAAEARLSKAEQARWERYIAALRTHEAEHVRIAQDGAPTVAAAIRAAGCAEAGAAAKAALARVSATSAEFDRRTGHGRSTIPGFP